MNHPMCPSYTPVLGKEVLWPTVEKRVDVLIEEYKQSQMRKQGKSECASCEKCTVQVAEYGHRLIGVCSGEEKRQSDTSHLSQSMALKARDCR
jgi:hypothetical protein